MQVALGRGSRTRSRKRTVAGAVLALLAATTLCAAALATVGSDDGRLPRPLMAPAGLPGPGEHPALAAKQTAAREQISATRPSDELSWPLRGAVTGQFGEPRGGRVHDGIDIPMPPGTPIRAAAAGRVVMREWQAGYGKYTCVAHLRVSTCYAHQARFRTRLGEEVRRGSVIGYVGNTGTGTVHLHFEVRRGKRPWGKPADPARFLR